MNPAAPHAITPHFDPKNRLERPPMNSLARFLHPILHSGLGLALALGATCATTRAESGKAFDTPEDAVSALMAAASAGDSNALRSIFGPAAADLENPDRVQATNEFQAFASALSQTHHLVRESDSKCILEVGPNAWPFPVPLVKLEGKWLFDVAAGKDELLNRRIGRNELTTLRVVRAYVEAQREYASKDRDGDEVLEFAQGFRSTPGKKDGLYWPPDIDGEISPLGPLAARAQNRGYALGAGKSGTPPEPFNGYYFKILTRQTKSAPGGKYDYVINGNMIGGFALVAWPASYGESGIMTFIVNQQGRVYERDLGKKTSALASKLTAYDPDPSWTLARD
jgi:hypothetical protein